MEGILVVKTGGSILRDEESLKKAVDMISATVARGYHVVVVVSAFKGVTDLLLQQAKKISPSMPGRVADEILALGERASARLLADALRDNGLEAVLVDPDSDLWPIITDSNHLDASPLYPETEERVKMKIQPLLEEGRVPVVCGFVGKDGEGHTTTLGRGGSDTTAVLIGSCLKAKEVVLVKDVDTVLSGDPGLVGGAVPVGELDVEEAYALSSGGAKILHHKALRFKKPSTRIRITSLDRALLGGTVIDRGSLDVKLEASDQPIAMLTVLVDDPSDTAHLAQLIDEVRGAGGRIASLTLDLKSILLYVAGGKGLTRRVHEFIRRDGWGKAVSVYEDLTMITVKGQAMETSPGMIQRVTQPLARRGINIYGLVTITSSINIFISKEDVERTLRLLGSALMAEAEGAG